MTEELLVTANSIKSRIEEIEALLAQLDLTDDSGVDTTERLSPISIQAGMAQVVQFEVLHEDGEEPTEMQKIDARIYDLLVKVLQDNY